MNNYKQEYNPFKEEGNSLIYKDHKDFFERFHELRANITESLGNSLFDPNELKQTITFVAGLIQWTSIYIQKMERLEEIDTSFNDILSSFKKGEIPKTRNNLTELYRKLNEIYEFNELIPQVKVVEKENEDLDVITKHALAAYKLVNCVK